MQGIFHFFDHDNYDFKKTYVLSNANMNVFIASVRLSDQPASHQVMALAKSNWGLKLTSAQKIRGLGAALVGLMDQSGIQQKIFLRPFALVYSEIHNTMEVSWRA